MEKTVKDHLVDIFDDLESEKLKRFKDKLRDRGEPPRVSRAAVDKTEHSFELADLMINTFTSKKAPAVTIQVLEAIGCNQQAEDLKKALGQSGPQGRAEPSTGGSSAPSNGQHFVDTHRKTLIDRVHNVDSILDELLQRNIITHEDYDKIRAKATNQHRMRELLSGPLKSAGTAGKDALYDALMESENFLMKELLNKN
ncbi:apoptosis-associated speck-like protein containing a CARD [Paramisgurnus dabryanus]|uniref:apoptosis-associated speck-like protein containing a CARD n=1 Tax=Paramisgurnus dabryanus TaxID=90735 RepID=UPI0031F42D2C